MMELKKSRVIFKENPHKYYIDGKELSGVTKIIRKQLFPDEYSAVPDEILAKAGERGTMVHKDCERYDVEDAEVMTPEGWEYMMLCNEKELHHVASEYLVSDEEFIASKIDKVYETDGGVILADIKTVRELNESYVSWQLSIYAYLFELMNPEIKVVELACIWLKADDAKYIRLERIDTEVVKSLLECEKKGEQFIRENPDCFPERFRPYDKKLYELEKQKAEIEEEIKRIKDEIAADMKDKGSMHWDGFYVGITMRKDSIREVFDTKKFKSENEELYNRYTKKSLTNGGIMLKLK